MPLAPTEKRASATGNVYRLSVWAMTSGQRKLFHLAGAVQSCGFKERVGNIGDELTHEKDAEWGDKERHDQPEVAVRQSEIADLHEQGDERGDTRDDQHEQHKAEQDALTGEVDLGQGVTGHGAEEQISQHAREGHDDAVAEI